MISVMAVGALVVLALLRNLDTVIDWPIWTWCILIARVLVTTASG